MSTQDYDFEILSVQHEHDRGVVTVKVRHDTRPHNDKTFKFEHKSRLFGSDRVKLKSMNMKKSEKIWTWSEQEITTLATAFELAKQEAEQEFEYSI